MNHTTGTAGLVKLWLTYWPLLPRPEREAGFGLRLEAVAPRALWLGRSDAELMGDLREFIRDSKLTQTAAALRLGISQSRVSDLVRGKWEKFSLEMLITLAARAGHRVDLRVVA